MSLINIGYGNYTSREKITAILQPGSSPIRRLIKDARDDHRLLDATLGKKTRSVIVMESGQIILSATNPETLNERFNQQALKRKPDEKL